jgi:histidine triad (HIT) family protein
MKECLFCKIVRKEIPAKIVFEDDRTVAFEDLRPQAPVHLLVIPREHIGTVMDIPRGDGVIDRLAAAARKLARDRGVADAGFRLVINCNAQGGQTVYHLHLHLLAGRPMTWPPG